MCNQVIPIGLVLRVTEDLIIISLDTSTGVLNHESQTKLALPV